MNAVQKKRPTSVTVIGWIFIAGAILMFLSGGMGLAYFTYIKHTAGGVPPVPEEITGQLRVMKFVFQHFELIAMVQVALAIFILIASIHFLRLRQWARTALEIIAWLGLVYLVGFGIFWVVSWIGITSSIPLTEGMPGPSPMFNIAGVVMGSLITVCWVVPFVVIIIFLRKNTVREVLL
jgi:hypothetical protein